MTLHEQQVTFARLVPSLLAKAFDMGFEVTLGETWRTPEQAEWNAEKGVGIKNSLHCERLAIDLVLFRAGELLRNSQDYEDLGAWWEKRHELARWGGRFGDGGHFSLERGGVK